MRTPKSRQTALGTVAVAVPGQSDERLLSALGKTFRSARRWVTSALSQTRPSRPIGNFVRIKAIDGRYLYPLSRARVSACASARADRAEPRAVSRSAAGRCSTCCAARSMWAASRTRISSTRAAMRRSSIRRYSMRSRNGSPRKPAGTKQRPTKAVLTGRLFDAMDEPMTPTFSHGRSGRLYRYYVSASLQQGGRCDNRVMRLPATAFEKFVSEAVIRWLPYAPSAACGFQIAAQKSTCRTSMAQCPFLTQSQTLGGKANFSVSSHLSGSRLGDNSPICQNFYIKEVLAERVSAKLGSRSFQMHPSNRRKS